jgi:hypothetical protein
LRVDFCGFRHTYNRLIFSYLNALSGTEFLYLDTTGTGKMENVGDKDLSTLQTEKMVLFMQKDMPLTMLEILLSP